MAINLKVPYYSQRNNEFYPSNTCNITSVAMCLAFYGIKAQKKPQLEDELFLKVKEKGWDRYTHDDLVKLFKLYGVDDKFTTEASWLSIKGHLDSGNPVVISGKFTSSGHIVVLRGYDSTGFFVNDPWGEYFASGYQDKTGENLHYSYNLLYRISYGGKLTCWAHFPTCKLRPPTKSPIYSALPPAGVELIKTFEGLFLSAYPDPLSGDKPITNGWGSIVNSSGEEWRLGDKITAEQADALLYYQLEKDYLPSLQKIPVWAELNSNEKGAILSFAYNLGADFYGSADFASMTNMLRTKNWSIAKETFVKYRNPGSKVEEGLKRRRLAEAELFLRPVR